MPLWAITIIVCGVIWIAGTVVLGAVANWLVHHEPH